MSIDTTSQRSDEDAADREETTEGLSLDRASGLAALARRLREPSGEFEPAMHRIVSSAVSSVEATDDAGLILVKRGRLVPVATTGPRPSGLDELQSRLGDGPCFTAAASQEPVVVSDLRCDPRWEALHATARQLQVGSMVCLPLWVGNRTNGALSLYSAQPAAYDAADMFWAELFATHAALALADAERSEQLRTALSTRDVLGQAKGILMERERIGADAAFSRLAEVSQRLNVKVTAVAEHLVRTGELLEVGSRPR